MFRGALRWLSRIKDDLRTRSSGVPKLLPEQLAEMAACDARKTEAVADPALSPLERLVHWWGKDAKPSECGAQLEALEARYDVRLPDDFRAYLTATMPKGNPWDSEGTNWWPLEDLKSVREECADWEDGSGLDGDEKAIVFADFLMWCFAWAIDCSDGPDRGRVIIVTGSSNRQVAGSFDDFLRRYINDSGSVM